VYFDHDNNSFAEQSGWVGKDDGLLVFDKNNNGKIDDQRLCAGIVFKDEQCTCFDIIRIGFVLWIKRKQLVKA
jgi:hypothetical protein